VHGVELEPAAQALGGEYLLLGAEDVDPFLWLVDLLLQVLQECVVG
jgi:hypothetical protein